MAEGLFYRHFLVLGETDIWSKAEEDELILFSLCEIRDCDLENMQETSLLKIRTAPRRFHKYNLHKPQEALVYYWSNRLGWHVMQPFWKEKDGCLTMDVEDTMEKAREQAQKEGAGYCLPEAAACLEAINHLNIHYHFAESGYLKNEDTNGGDWARAELSIHFADGAFALDGQPIGRLLIASHWEVEEAWKRAEEMLHTDSWSWTDFAQLIRQLDTYDTTIRLYYPAEGTERVMRMRMNGGRIDAYENEGWPEAVAAVIREINARS